MKVQDIMAKQIISLKPDDSFLDAVNLIIKHKISGIPVLDGDECIGIVSEKDLLKKLFPTYEELFEVDVDAPLYKYDLENLEHKTAEVKGIKIKDIMKTEVIFVDPELPILEAASMMILYRVRRLPVLEKHKLVGIISQGDVFRAILSNEIK